MKITKVFLLVCFCFYTYSKLHAESENTYDVVNGVYEGEENKDKLIKYLVNRVVKLNDIKTKVVSMPLHIYFLPAFRYSFDEKELIRQEIIKSVQEALDLKLINVSLYLKTADDTKFENYSKIEEKDEFSEIKNGLEKAYIDVVNDLVSLQARESLATNQDLESFVEKEKPIITIPRFRELIDQSSALNKFFQNEKVANLSASEINELITLVKLISELPYNRKSLDFIFDVNFSWLFKSITCEKLFDELNVDDRKYDIFKFAKLTKEVQELYLKSLIDIEKLGVNNDEPLNILINETEAKQGDRYLLLFNSLAELYSLVNKVNFEKLFEFEKTKLVLSIKLLETSPYKTNYFTQHFDRYKNLLFKNYAFKELYDKTNFEKIRTTDFKFKSKFK